MSKDETSAPRSSLEVIAGDSELLAITREFAAPAKWYRYFTVGKTWWPDRRPPVAVADMDHTWRYNAAQYLLRHAVGYSKLFIAGCHAELLLIAVSDADEGSRGGMESQVLRSMSLAQRDPQAWAASTALYRSLMMGLPESGAKRRKLQEKARHWTGCPKREGAKATTCTCEQLRARHEARRAVPMPEWTP